MTNDALVLDSDLFPRVALEFMNQTHYEEIELVNTLGRQLTACPQQAAPSDQEKDNIRRTLMCWLQHTKAHFARENELMEQTGFPMYAVHAAEHERILEELALTVQQWQRKPDIQSLTDYVFSEWPYWFKQHVSTMDNVTAQYAAMHGYQD